jgi:hypothetical protein
MAAAICYGVRGGGAQLCFHVQAGSYDTDTLIQVIKQLRVFLGGEKATCCGTACPPTQRGDAGPAFAELPRSGSDSMADSRVAEK